MYQFNDKQSKYITDYCRKKFGCVSSDFERVIDYDAFDTYIEYTLPRSFGPLCDNASELYTQIDVFEENVEAIFDGFDKADTQDMNAQGIRPQPDSLPYFTSDAANTAKKMRELRSDYKNTLVTIKDIILEDEIPSDIRDNLQKAIKMYNRAVYEINTEIRKYNKAIDVQMSALSLPSLDALRRYLYIPHPLPLRLLDNIADILDLNYLFGDPSDFTLDKIKEVTLSFDEYAELAHILLQLD